MTTHTHTHPIHNQDTGSLRTMLGRYRLMSQPSAARGPEPRIPHPGDILYWVGCVGAVSALLFFALR